MNEGAAAEQTSATTSNAASPSTTGSPVWGATQLNQALTSWWLAASLPATAGIVLYGMAAARILFLAIAAALIAEALFGRLRWPGGATTFSHAGLMGLLLALTLPAAAPWPAALIGSIIAIAIGKLAMRGTGRYVWQPALVGRVAVQFIFSQQLSFSGGMSQSAILVPGKLVFGEIENATQVERGAQQGWGNVYARPGDDAILMERPVQAIRRLAGGGTGADPSRALLHMTRDELPPWEDTLIGVIPGGIGETASVALLVSMLYLIWRNALRWHLPAGLFMGAALAATMFPIRAGPHGPYVWWPGAMHADGWPVGIVYVLFQMTGGQLLFAAALLAGDPSLAPRGRRAQWLTGFGVGVITIFMRLYGLAECESYWAVLAMNTASPTLERLFTRR